MNLTPKVTVIYAFSNTGQSIEPHFIFPTSLCDNTIIDEKDSYNELGHLTPQIFLSWIENYLHKKDNPPIVLIFCSRLPVLSTIVLSSLKNYQIYPYGYPYTRTLPFRYLFERRVRNNRSTNLMSELWKKKLLDEQRTHVLKGLNCTVKNIKYYFQQIWLQIINEKQDDDENIEDKYQQAFQQANIQIKITQKKNLIKLTPKKNSKKIQNNDEIVDEIVDELNQIINITSKYKEQIISANPSQILKMNNHIEQSTDCKFRKTILQKNDHTTNNSFTLICCFLFALAQLSPTMDNTENIHPPSTSSELVPSPNPIIPSTSDKRSIDENDEPHISKRLRSSCSQASNSSNTTTIIKWIPPSKQFVINLQSQSASLFQFTLSLIRTIFSSTDNHLTDEHSRWLHSTLNLYGHNDNNEKINVLIETACKVAKLNLVR